MPVKIAPTARTVAHLVITVRMAFDVEFKRRTSRFRISNKTLRKLADRPRLWEAFRNELIEELARLQYWAFEYEDYLAVIDTRAVRGWVRISPNRVEETLHRVHAGDKTALKKLAADAERDRFGHSLSGTHAEGDE